MLSMFILFLMHNYFSSLSDFMILQAAKSLRGMFSETNHSELAAFASYALSFPTKFQALVDTFDVSLNLVWFQF